MSSERLRVGFQGEPGAYGWTAVETAWQGAAEPIPVAGFERLLEDLALGRVDRAVLPVENTVVGAVAPALAATLGSGPVFVIGEVTVPVHHCLAARPGTALSDVRRVISHPVALAQCGGWLARHPGIRTEPWSDTAGAARAVAEGADPEVAAIASASAARRHGLELLAEELQDVADNATRFWILGRERERQPRGSVVRTTLLLQPEQASDGPAPPEHRELAAALSAVGSDPVWLAAAADGKPHAWVLELTHRAGPPDPTTLIRRLAPGWRARSLGSRPPGRPTPELPAVTLWAVRGATTVSANERSAVHAATRELIATLLHRNQLTPDDLLSAVFTVTPDLTTAFPAEAARAVGWTEVPLLCATEIKVEGGLPRCVRVLLQVHGPLPDQGIHPVYLREATRLRPDLAAPNGPGSGLSRESPARPTAAPPIQSDTDRATGRTPRA